MRYSERAYRALRDDIVQWRLQPGDLLREVQIAARLDISRTPVREALQRLTREGLVRQIPHQGAVVTEISLDDVVQLFQMREALETHAARLAARSNHRRALEQLGIDFEAAVAQLESAQPDSDFTWYFTLIERMDEAIDVATGNPRLTTAIIETRGQIRRLRRLAGRNTHRLRVTADEHRSICEAIASGEETMAAQTTAVHIHNSLQNVLRQLAQDALGTPAQTSSVQPPAAMPTTHDQPTQ